MNYAPEHVPGTAGHPQVTKATRLGFLNAALREYEQGRKRAYAEQWTLCSDGVMRRNDQIRALVIR